MPAPEIALKKTGKVRTEFLEFDLHNPRLIEDGIKNPTEGQIIRALADTADLSEIVQSIAANGYIDIEPLVAQRVNGKWRVLEGNRRLAAIRILQKPELAKGTGIQLPERLSKEVRDSLKEVTVYAVADPDQARDFIGFKHINGPHKWDAYAKGRFAANWYRKEKENGITVEQIAQRLGDRHDTVVRLVNGIFVLDQAQEEKVYDLQDRYPGRRFAFSHLYTALTRPGYREFLGLPDEWRDADPQPNPVPDDKLNNLKRVMIWLYGSKADDIEPIIVSQNPHIKHLGAVLQNSRARSILMMRNDLREAYAQVETKSERFEKSLINAKQEAENAMAQITGYDPADTTLLEMGEELNKTSDLLYTNMLSMAKKAAGTVKARK
jgi:ParB-like nuclease domain